MSVIDINARLEQKKEYEQIRGFISFIRQDILPYMNYGEKMELLESLKQKDEAKLRSLTEPILRRKILWEVNKENKGGK